MVTDEFSSNVEYWSNNPLKNKCLFYNVTIALENKNDFECI